MTKLSGADRLNFIRIIEGDLSSIQQRVIEQIRHIWDESRNEIMVERGYDVLIERKALLQQERDNIKEQIHEIEEELASERLTVQQALELGGKPNRYERYEDAHFFSIPVDNQLDYDIVQRIKEKVDTEAPAKYLSDLGRSSLRELTMAGTFEEAQKIYEDFYALDFRKYGVDIPPRLTEMREAKDKGTEFMLGYSKEQKSLPETSEKNTKQPKVDDQDGVEVA